MDGHHGDNIKGIYMKLKAKHIIMLSKIVAKMDVTVDMKGKTVPEVGGEILFSVLKHISKAEDEFYELLGDLLEVTPAKAAEMALDDIAQTLKDIIPAMVAFFKPPTA